MKRRKSNLPVVITALIVVVVLVVTIFVASKLGNGMLRDKGKEASKSTSKFIIDDDDDETESEEVVPVSTALIGSAGDILIHKPLLEGAYSNGSYDFNDIFTFVKDTVNKCDYFVANLEVTLGGEERGYKSYPCFNTPDSIVDAAQNAGIDCLLTANNHCYDTSEGGLIRTLGILNEKRIDHVGTRLTENDSKYIVREVNGIKFGITCYTYETPSEGAKAINGIVTSSEAAPLINSFNYSNLSAFYTDIKEQIDEMRDDGAEVIIVYPHWGEEYQLPPYAPNSYQKEIAQKLCDMGVDVIIGGHPHVVQPVELLSSTTDSSHKTACLYSMGNFVSNQRRQYMSIKDGHTEDGLIFELSFTKYSDGTVSFDKVKSIPTWVHLYGTKPVYAITPLSDKLGEEAGKLGLNNSSGGLSGAQSSYERTIALVGEGTKAVNSWLKGGVTVSTPVDDEDEDDGFDDETDDEIEEEIDDAA